MQTQERVILNLGCGKKHIKGAVNVDINPPYDLCCDLNEPVWMWKDRSVDKIIMHHSLEHLKDPQNALIQCWWILKVGGELEIHVPHSSLAGAVGCLRHYRTFSYNSIKDYMQHFFKTTHQRIVYLPHFEWLPLQWLIDLSPILFERFWCYWVGGATEVQWKGIKI